MDPRSDAELVAAASRGDRAAFAALYARHRDWVVGLARRFTRDDETALDVMQETFAYLLRKGAGLRLTARLTTFLYPVVKNTALAMRRRERAGALGEDVEARPVAPAADHGALIAAVSILPETHREVLLMRFVDDMALDEIAAALSIPVGTVKSRLHHAIRMLRENPGIREYFERPG